MPRILAARRKPRYDRNLIVFTGPVILIASLGLYFGLPLWQTHLALHPPRLAIESFSPADLGLDYTDVTLSTQDGLTLYGWYMPATNRAAVILVHAFNGNRSGTIYHAALLVKHGYGALLYDTRAQGESKGEPNALGWQDHLDILAALDYLQQRPFAQALLQDG